MMKTILVVEDETDILETLVDLFDLEGYAVYSAQNGAAALKLARQHHPDLIVSDVMMPQMDGFEMFAALRRDTTTSGIPVVFLTALIDNSDAQRGIAMGVNAYLTKPFTNQDLLDVVRDLIG